MADRVLIVGGNGFIGRSLTRSLTEKGIPVIAASRGGFGFEHELTDLVSGDFTKPEDFTPLIMRSHAVIHLATTSTPGTSAAQPLREVETNLRVTAALLQALQDYPRVNLIYMSSGGALYTDAQGESSVETTSVRPRSYHGAAKIAAEAFITAWSHQNRSSATILRPSNVYGPGQPELPGFGVIPAALGAMRRNQALHVWGDGSVRRDYIYIEDLIRLCVAVLNSPMPRGTRIFNACSGTSISLNELFERMELLTGRMLQRTYDVARAVDASCIAMSAGLANREYGWVHQTTLTEGLKRTWESLASDFQST